MKWLCEVVQDLIPLYQDECCSQESRKVVEEHVAECARCGKLLRDMSREIANPAGDDMAGGAVSPADQGARAAADSEETIRAAEERRRMRNSFGKIRALWRRRLAAAVVGTIALLLVVSLAAHEILGEGLAFSNMDEVWRSRRFFAFVRTGQYEQAARMMDFTATYEALRGQLAVPTEYDYLHNYTEFIWDGQSFLIEKGCLDGIGGLPEESPVDGTVAQIDGTDVWRRLLESHRENCMIPEKAWEQITKEQPVGSPDPETTDGFMRVKTPWGVYYVKGTVLEYMIRALLDADFAGARFEETLNPSELFMRAEVMPKDVYLDAEAGDLLQDMGKLPGFEEQYGYLRELSEAEFVEMMQRRFARAMQEWARNGGRIQRISFAAAYRSDREWQIDMRVLTEESGAGQEYIFHMFYSEGGIAFGGLPVWGVREGDKVLFDEALHIRYDAAAEDD